MQLLHLKVLMKVGLHSTDEYHIYWDLKLTKLSKFSTKIMIAVEDVESKNSTDLKHQEYVISSSILGDPII